MSEQPGNPNADATGQQRLEVNISPDTAHRLRFWTKYDGTSATQVTRAAIGVYSELRSAQLEGDAIFIRRSDGSYEEVMIPPTLSS